MVEYTESGHKLTMAVMECLHVHCTSGSWSLPGEAAPLPSVTNRGTSGRGPRLIQHVLLAVLPR